MNKQKKKQELELERENQELIKSMKFIGEPEETSEKGEYYKHLVSGMDFDVILLLLIKRKFIFCKRDQLHTINEVTIPYTNKVLVRPGFRRTETEV